MIEINKIKSINFNTINALIIGNDLDALLSACLLKSEFGWDIVGIYDYQSLWYDSKLTKEKFLANLKSSHYLAVDLDIYRNYVPSIGHHILSLHPNDVLPQHKNSINPNLYFGITHEKFEKKYPLGTIHFLMCLLNAYPNFTRLGEMLLWLADSTFINAQSHRFAKNVKHWVGELVPNRILKHGLHEINTLAFEEEMSDVLFPLLNKTGLARGKGQVRSLHKKLQGFQCQWENPNPERSNIVSLLKIIEQNTNWQSPQLPLKFSAIKGKRFSFKFSNKENNQPEYLREFLAEKKAFSYVITNRYLINYTINIDF